MLKILSETRKLSLHVAAIAIEHFLSCRQRLDLFLGEATLEFVGNRVHSFDDGLFHILLQ